MHQSGKVTTAHALSLALCLQRAVVTHGREQGVQRMSSRLELGGKATGPSRGQREPVSSKRPARRSEETQKRLNLSSLECRQCRREGKEERVRISLCACTFAIPDAWTRGSRARSRRSAAAASLRAGQDEEEVMEGEGDGALSWNATIPSHIFFLWWPARVFNSLTCTGHIERTKAGREGEGESETERVGEREREDYYQQRGLCNRKQHTVARGYRPRESDGRGEREREL